MRMNLYFRVEFPYGWKYNSVVCEEPEDVHKLLKEIPLHTTWDDVSTRIFSRQTLDFDYGILEQEWDWGFDNDKETMRTASITVEPMLLFEEGQVTSIKEEYYVQKTNAETALAQEIKGREEEKGKKDDSS